MPKTLLKKNAKILVKLFTLILIKNAIFLITAQNLKQKTSTSSGNLYINNC